MGACAYLNLWRLSCTSSTGNARLTPSLYNLDPVMKKAITYGTFDLFHEGHYRLLKRAKALSDYLIVGVTTESYDAARGKLNVVDSLLTRIENVRKTGFADEIIIEESPGQKIEDIQKYGIDIFFIGSDWIGSFDYLKSLCEVVYLERTWNISSTMLRRRNRPIIKLGIIGNGRIAARFLPEASAVSGINVNSVYNPHIESSQAFARQHSLDAPTSLDKFLEGVDAVYVASPHATHYDYARLALKNGKHVLCEKPLALSKAHAEELFSIAKENHLILFEGIKTAYSPGFRQLQGIAASGIIGEIRCIDACFTKLVDPLLRELADTQYGGSFLELGSYVLLPILKFYGSDYINLSFQSINGVNGLDIYTRAYFQYDRGLASGTCGLGVKSPGELIISGTMGYIQVDAPWWKTTSFTVRHEDPNEVEKYSERFLGDGLRYEIADFTSAIYGNKHNDFKLTRNDSIWLASVMEKFIKERHK